MNLPEFRYQSFEPASAVATAAETYLAKLQAEVPAESTVIARLEFDGVEYGCTVDVFLKYHSVYTFRVNADPVVAVAQATQDILNKLNGVPEPVVAYQSVLRPEAQPVSLH